ncbi:MAG TPA: hypothetical protein VFO76_12290 [Candidatus Kapabacteria bacterium]|nr:hypothetical protein [Candidatus Kapabacteria bacterium]
MKNFFFLLLAAVVLTVAVSSCSSSSTETPPTTYTPTPVHFQQGKIARYDLYLIDTPSSDGSNIDHFVPDSTKYNLEEQVVDTAFAFPLGIKATKTVFASTPPDTSYYYQDKDGNLFRYNYGFNTLNNFKDLILALGSPVDVGWVLIAKPGAPSGTTWLAKKDSMRTGGFGILYLGTMRPR